MILELSSIVVLLFLFLSFLSFALSFALFFLVGFFCLLTLVWI